MRWSNNGQTDNPALAYLLEHGESKMADRGFDLSDEMPTETSLNNPTFRLLEVILSSAKKNL